MGKIFCVIGKSSTGKDTIYSELLNRSDLDIKKVVPYTTRPLREGELPGKEYFFCDEERVRQLEEDGKIIELREYDTIYGIWKYFTVDDGQIDLDAGNYLLIGTLEMYQNLKRYFGEKKVCPIYIEVEDGERLMRAIARERLQDTPKYQEMCRRFLTDSGDFSEEKIQDAGIKIRFENRTLEDTIEQIVSYIHQVENTEE
ncbi:MAG: guanylate kinase [Agathobacter sp.]|nr:guanylate kinase [Agathobacter sp.]